MSFGRPGFTDAFKVTPPARGSFPLDHDGECKSFMMSYLKCLKANSANNGECRLQSKKYLECRMDNGLMQRDDMANLGLGDVVEPIIPTAPTSIPAPPAPAPTPIPPNPQSNQAQDRI